MPDYTLDSDWRQPVIEWNGTPLSKEEVYKRIIRGVTNPEWWERWVYHGGGMPDTTQAYEEALGQYDSRFD